MEIVDVEKFENWSKSRGYLHNFDKEDCFPPVYEHPDTQYAWEVWVSAIDSTGALNMLEKLEQLYEWLEGIGDGAPDASATSRKALNEAAEIADLLQRWGK